MYVCMYVCMGGHVGWMLADQSDGLSSSSFLAWSSIAQSVCQQAFSLLEIGFQRPSGFESCIRQRKTTCLQSIRKSLACARASKLTTTNMYIARARCECRMAVGHWMARELETQCLYDSLDGIHFKPFRGWMGAKGSFGLRTFCVLYEIFQHNVVCHTLYLLLLKIYGITKDGVRYTQTHIYTFMLTYNYNVNIKTLSSGETGTKIRLNNTFRPILILLRCTTRVHTTDIQQFSQR